MPLKGRLLGVNEAGLAETARAAPAAEMLRPRLNQDDLALQAAIDRVQTLIASPAPDGRNADRRRLNGAHVSVGRDYDFSSKPAVAVAVSAAALSPVVVCATEAEK